MRYDPGKVFGEEDEMGSRLDGRVAVVTGGASGIGRAIAVQLAAEGARVVVGDLRDDPCEGGAKTEELIAERGGTCVFRRTDVSKWDDVDGLVMQAVEGFGRLDVMVNNAAIWAGQRLTETTEADWDRVMATNLKGVFFGCKRAVQAMLEQAPREVDGDLLRGRIVNISSQHGMIACPNDLAYGVSKAGVVYMTRQIAVDYAGEGILCNAVAPGKILTGRGGDAVTPEALAYSRARTPLPRLGRPQDVARAVTFLASDEASYITGENLMVDGGWMAG
jgi:NAD(P)-dependent dehydrogenase (short-subunit alcohol dehydrogenase family)